MLGLLVWNVCACVSESDREGKGHMRRKEKATRPQTTHTWYHASLLPLRGVVDHLTVKQRPSVRSTCALRSCVRS